MLSHKKIILEYNNNKITVKEKLAVAPVTIK